MRCGAGLLQKEHIWEFLNKSSKISLLCRAIDPTFQDKKKEEEIRIIHLSTAKNSLEADTMLDSHVALHWRVSLGSVPSSSKSKWSANPHKTTIIGNVQRIILGRATRSHPARQKTRRSAVEPFVTNSTTMQSSWSTRRGYLSTLGLPLSTDVHILACVHSTWP